MERSGRSLRKERKAVLMKKDWKPEIVWLDPKELTPYINNSKIHSDEQIDKLAGVIAEFGFTQPILVDKDKVIVAGHGRREAALRLNMSSVPVVFADHLDENQIKASRIADNKLASLEYDKDKLAFDIGTLDRAGFDLNLTGIGFDEIKDLLNPSVIENSSQELDLNNYSDFEHKCPKCGFEWSGETNGA